MQTFGALAVISLILFALAAAADAGDQEVAAAYEVDEGRARILPAEHYRHVPLICLDSHPVAVATATATVGARARDFAHTDEVECRPIDRDVRP